MADTLGELIAADSKLFAKSEFGPANSDWPALSFSAMKIANDFQKDFRRGKDFVIYVGTSNPKDTPGESHRQRLISVVEVEARGVVQTKDLVSPEAWKRAQEKYPGRWDYSLILSRAWEIDGFPRAHDCLPTTYAQFQNPGTRGHPIPVSKNDLEFLRPLALHPVRLELTERAVRLLSLNADDILLRKNLSRLTLMIQNDITQSGKVSTGANPVRHGPNYSDVYALLHRCWEKQKGLCLLCGEAIPVKTDNKLLQMSRDRIDSINKGYVEGNVQLTHCGCNLAKSDATMDEWKEYIAMVKKSGGN